jgi:hypothetical protein
MEGNEYRDGTCQAMTHEYPLPYCRIYHRLHSYLGDPNVAEKGEIGCKPLTPTPGQTSEPAYTYTLLGLRWLPAILDL